jgi:ribosomal protein S18 acetylase RimI-like enzyme
VTIYRHVGPEGAIAATPALKAVYAAVFSRPPYNEGSEMWEKFTGWVRDESQEPGFDMVVAGPDGGGDPVGFAYGYRQPPGKWWRGADQPAPAEVKHGSTFAVMEWAVLPDHRGAGIGRRLMDELLNGRSEPYAVLTVNPAAEARQVYERWGWQHVASTRPGRMPGMDVMLLALG